MGSGIVTALTSSFKVKVLEVNKIILIKVKIIERFNSFAQNEIQGDVNTYMQNLEQQRHLKILNCDM
jgi:hypothetical protein